MRANIAILVGITLTWSLLVRSFIFPGPAIIRYTFACATIFAIVNIYKGFFIRFAITRLEVCVLFSYFILFALLNNVILAEAIASDELLHAEMSALPIGILLALLSRFSMPPVLYTIPVNDLSYYVSGVLLSLFSLAYVLYTRYYKSCPAWLKHALFLIVLLIIGFLARYLPGRIENYPPMRLIPLFISQLFLGVNDFAFRIPGIAAVSFVSLLTFKLVLNRVQSRYLFSYLIGFSIYMIPTVFHSSAQVEPSIWAFCSWALCIYAVYWAYEKNDADYMIAAGLIVGVGSLFRQTVFVLWPVLLLFFVINPHFRQHLYKKKSAVILVRTFLPGLFVIPYLVTVKALGHAATTSGLSLANVYESIVSGAWLTTTLHSTTLPWCIFFISGLCIVLYRSKRRIKYFYLSYFPAYILYFGIVYYLWNSGRYQAEYIAPLIMMTIFLLSIELKKTSQNVLAAVLVFLSLFSFHANATTRQDIHYDLWTYKKISTDSTFPYKEAISFLQRQQTDGKFIIIGGVPTYGNMILWLRGFTLSEAENYRIRQDKFNSEFLSSTGPKNASDFFNFLKKNDVHFFAIQYGDKRELQHRAKNLQQFMKMMTDFYVAPLNAANAPYTLQQTFIGKFEGAIDLYSVNTFRY